MEPINTTTKIAKEILETIRNQIGTKISLSRDKQMEFQLRRPLFINITRLKTLINTNIKTKL